MSKPAHLTATLHLASTWGDLASSPLQPHPVEHSTSQRQHKRLASLVNDSGSPGDCATLGHLTAPRDRRSGYLIEIGGTHRSYWPSIVLLAMAILQASPRSLRANPNPSLYGALAKLPLLNAGRGELPARELEI